MSSEIFQHREGQLFCGDVPVESVAGSVPTPFYLYDATCVQQRYRGLERAFSSVPHLTCYAFKANSQPEILRILLKEGAGAEVVSGAELQLALAVGFAPEKIVFSGVGKTVQELFDGLRADVHLFTVESEGELLQLERLASQVKRSARVALRINPDVDPMTHPHIATGVNTAKFGLELEVAFDLYTHYREFPHLEFIGVHTHIGSQLTSIEPLRETARLLEDLVSELRDKGVPLREVDWGGGLGIPYIEESVPTFEEYAQCILPWISRMGLRVILEPGRTLVGPCGALVMKVLYRKEVHGRRFVVVDGAMNDLIRPALYGAHHRIVPVVMRNESAENVDIVGAACESSDVFGRDRPLGEMRQGDMLCVLDTGAYGFSMSSNYNLRPRPAEVLTEGDTFRIVREAETMEDLVARELGGES
jgi:diaminopimelate decarboxylase